MLRVRDNHLKDTVLLTLKHLSGLIILDRSKNILNDSDFVCKQWKSRVTALDISENDVGHINIDNNCFHNPYASKSGIRSIQTVDAALTRFIYVAGNNLQDISFLNKIPLLGYTHFSYKSNYKRTMFITTFFSK